MGTDGTFPCFSPGNERETVLHGTKVNTFCPVFGAVLRGRPPFCGTSRRSVVSSSECRKSGEPSGRPVWVHLRISANSSFPTADPRYAHHSRADHRLLQASISSQEGASCRAQCAAALDQVHAVAALTKFARTGFRDAFVRELARVRERLGFRLVGYVAMPEHVHLLISEPQKGTPSTVLHDLKLSVARRLRKRPRRTATEQMRFRFGEGEPPPRAFWQARFYDFNVYTEKKERKAGVHARESGESWIGETSQGVALEQLVKLCESGKQIDSGRSFVEKSRETASPRPRF